MEKDKIQLGITGVLIIILSVLLARAMSGKRQNQPAVVENAVSQSKVTVPEGAEGIKEESLYAKLVNETRDLEFGRDPFSKQPVTTSGSSQELHLSGILWDDVTPTAIINDEIVAVGSRIQGGRVVDIRKDKVILEEGDYHIELILE
ncbi:MAG: hypothetical protein A2705_05085 [Omnitrophica WOR_2 bacterium RIFCSPHIGHO2_01_FULL_52_10]|nr:MAG: hypothetical protein A2705_05085 [Omnitrophica WOR_2 bacterium RIFCSPHIGHO2_01_FULL_52_10]